MPFSSLYKFDYDITPEDHHSMACGLSSILNLGCQSQRSLYTPIEWQNLQDVFVKKYKAVTLHRY
ncbi:hypothetical protein AB4K20DRAFT_1905179 [Rhizopus microsporus]